MSIFSRHDDTQQDQPAQGRNTVEKLFEARYPDPAERERHSWVLAAVRTAKGWGVGKELDPGEFDAAVEQVMGIRISSEHVPMTPQK